jgi:hypothetical protein
MIPIRLEERDGSIDVDGVVILVATGTHRPHTDGELRAMFGDQVVDASAVAGERVVVELAQACRGFPAASARQHARQAPGSWCAPPSELGRWTRAGPT